jgi:hypothetical protein
MRAMKPLPAAAGASSGKPRIHGDPYYEEALEVPLGPLPDASATANGAHPEARPQMVSTPSSPGTSGDVRAHPDGFRVFSESER